MLNNQNGVALVELVPLLGLFILLVNFSLGFFGLIHSGIINSIAARTYAFEAIGNRSNLVYLRDQVDTDLREYVSVGQRFFGIKSDSTGSSAIAEWAVTKRPIKFTDISADRNIDFDQPIRDRELLKIKDDARASEVAASFVEDDIKFFWVRVMYGICLNATCTGRP
jgi:hypothetical protein